MPYDDDLSGTRDGAARRRGSDVDLLAHPPVEDEPDLGPAHMELSTPRGQVDDDRPREGGVPAHQFLACDLERRLVDLVTDRDRDHAHAGLEPAVLALDELAPLQSVLRECLEPFAPSIVAILFVHGHTEGLIVTFPFNQIGDASRLRLFGILPPTQ